MRWRFLIEVACSAGWLLACASESAEEAFPIPPPTAIGTVRDAGVPRSPDGGRPTQPVSAVCTGAPKPEVLAPKIKDPTTFAVRIYDGEVYALSDSDLRAYRLDTKAERVVSTFPSIHDAEEIVVDESGVYLVGDGEVQRVPRIGGAPETIFTATSPHLVGTDATHVYVTANGLFRIDKATSASEPVGQEGPSGRSSFHGGYYFRQRGDAAQELYRLKPDPLLPSAEPELIVDDGCLFTMSDDTLYCATTTKLARYSFDGVALPALDLPPIDERTFGYFVLHADAKNVLLRAFPDGFGGVATESFFVTRKLNQGVGAMVGCSIEPPTPTTSTRATAADGQSVVWATDDGRLLMFSY